MLELKMVDAKTGSDLLNFTFFVCFFIQLSAEG